MKTFKEIRTFVIKYRKELQVAGPVLLIVLIIVALCGKPGQPTVGLRSTGQPEARLTWTGAQGGTVKIFRDDVLLTEVPNNGTYVDTTVENYKAYTYKVCETTEQELNRCSNVETIEALPSPTPTPTTSPTQTPTASPLPSIPVAPSNVNVVASDCQEITITWNDNSSNEQGFKIDRSNTGTGFTEVGSVEANVTTFVNRLNQGGKRYYRVRAWNAAGETFSPIASATTETCVSPTPTATATSTPTATATPTETPSPSPTPTETPTPTEAPTETPTPSPTETPSPSPSPTPTPVPTETPIGPAPTAPSTLTARVVKGKDVQLEWLDNSSDEVGFEIERAEKVGDACRDFLPRVYVGKDTKQWTDTETVKQKIYCFQVRAVGENGTRSAWSNAVVIRP
jgi:hypothetical protein